MSEVYASGEYIDTIWYANTIEWHHAIESLKSHGYNTQTFILIKERGSDRAGIGIKDPEVYIQAKMILS